MAKKTIGYFEKEVEGNITKYVLWYEIVQRKFNKFVYIGNTTRGWFFKFAPSAPEEITISAGDYHTTKLHIPLSDIDIAEILNMMFTPKNLKIKELKMFSRKDIIELVVLEGI